MKLGNAKVLTVVKEENGSISITAEHLPEDKDFKNTKKINWLSKDSALVI